MDQNYIVLRPCPVCNNKSGSILASLTYALFDDLDIPGAKSLICCHKCGMIYDDVAFTEEHLQKYYRGNEHYAASSLGGGGGVSADNNERYDRIIETLKPNTNDLIIDYGCGQGGFIARCRHYGLKAAGIEPSEKSREVARESGLLVYESEDAFIAENSACQIHSIVFSHVMEHMLNPTHPIHLFSRHAKGALVYMEVPDADSYLSPEVVLWHEMYFEHLSHFRQPDLANFAGLSGIEILKQDRVPFSKDLSDTKCLVLAGRFSGILKKVGDRKTSDDTITDNIPPLSIGSIPNNDSSLALWGISQYAMLLIGSCPKFARRVTRLFDASPAKIGRRINGIVIESVDKLSTLSQDIQLIIPKSKFLPQMLDQLPDTGFQGAARVI
jgi:hypothetical protein